MHRLGYVISIVLVMAAAVPSALAGKEFRPPRAADVNSYPARDDHRQEHIAVAINPYDTPEKAAIFPTHWSQYGLLPVQMIIANSGDHPIALNRMKVELVTVNRTRIQPASDQDLYRRISRTKHRGDEGSPLPMPIPRKKPNVGVPKEAQQEVEAAQFRAEAVEPHGSQAGFLFFDVEGIKEPLAGAHLYVTGITDGNGQEVMFFDVALDNYLKPQGQ
jgi:hypothetical protein